MLQGAAACILLPCSLIDNDCWKEICKRVRRRLSLSCSLLQNAALLLPAWAGAGTPQSALLYPDTPVPGVTCVTAGFCLSFTLKGTF